MGQGALSKPVVQWWLSLNSSTPLRPPVHRLLTDARSSERTQTVKGRRREGSSTQFMHTLPPPLRPPAHRRCQAAELAAAEPPPSNTTRAGCEEQSPHRNMLGMKRAKGHALLLAPCRCAWGRTVVSCLVLPQNVSSSAVHLQVLCSGGACALSAVRRQRRLPHPCQQVAADVRDYTKETAAW